MRVIRDIFLFFYDDHVTNERERKREREREREERGEVRSDEKARRKIVF